MLLLEKIESTERNLLNTIFDEKDIIQLNKMKAKIAEAKSFFRKKCVYFLKKSHSSDVKVTQLTKIVGRIQRFYGYYPEGA